MSHSTYTVRDALKFGGHRERAMAIALIEAAHVGNFADSISEQLYNDCLSSDWMSENIPFVCYSTNSGNVWISGGSEGYDALMLNDNDQVEFYVYTPHSGIEGFLSELIEDLNNPTESEREYNWSYEGDVEYIRNLESQLSES